jgi:hypothetical protein
MPANSNSIPKKIHYCWLSKDKMPEVAEKCLHTWREKMLDYELVLWNTDRFDVNSVPFVKQAYEMRKWAFAADYIRLYAIYNEGGIYFDTDVYVKKSFDDLLNYDFFTSLERDLTTVPWWSNYAKALKRNENPNFVNSEMKRVEGFGLQAAIFGAKAGNPFIKDCMDWYEKNNFLFDNSKKKQMVAPDIYAAIAQKYGFKYVCGFQQLKGNMVIMPADFFPNHLHKTSNAYAVHLCDNSWSDLRRYSKPRSNNIFGKITQLLFGKRHIKV